VLAADTFYVGRIFRFLYFFHWLVSIKRYMFCSDIFFYLNSWGLCMMPTLHPPYIYGEILFSFLFIRIKRLKVITETPLQQP